MGILLSAMAAAGDAGVKSMDQNIEQQNRMDLEEQRSRLEQAKAQYLAESNNKLGIDSANQQRIALADRLKLSPEDLQALAAKNAGNDKEADWVHPDTVLNADGTAPDDAVRIKPGYDDLTPEDQAQYAATSRQRMQAQAQKAFLGGDFAAGEALLKSAETGRQTMRFGDVIKDGEGNLIADNGSSQLAELKQATAEANAREKDARSVLERAKAGNVGQPKVLDQAKLDRIEKDVSGAVSKYFTNKPNPIPQLGEDPKAAVDSSKINLASSLVKDYMQSAEGHHGQPVSINAVMSQAMPVIDAFDKEVTLNARAQAASIFSKDTDLDKAREMLLAKGFPPAAVASSDSLARYLREEDLTNDKFKAYAQALKQRKGSTGAPPAAALPITPPQKRGILAPILDSASTLGPPSYEDNSYGAMYQ